MPYSHVVSFKYHSHVAEATRAEVYRRFLDLKNLCTVDSDRRDKSQGSASTGLYIASLIGGQANISLEGAGRGFDVSASLLVWFRCVLDPDSIPSFLAGSACCPYCSISSSSPSAMPTTQDTI